MVKRGRPPKEPWEKAERNRSQTKRNPHGEGVVVAGDQSETLVNVLYSKLLLDADGNRKRGRKGNPQLIADLVVDGLSAIARGEEFPLHWPTASQQMIFMRHGVMGESRKLHTPTLEGPLPKHDYAIWDKQVGAMVEARASQKYIDNQWDCWYRTCLEPLTRVKIESIPSDRSDYPDYYGRYLKQANEIIHEIKGDS